VRGDLGPVTVWTTADTWEGKHEEESAWRKVYQGQHEPTARPRRGQPATYTTLKLTEVRAPLSRPCPSGRRPAGKLAHCWRWPTGPRWI
jgi:hypothetical protein